MGSTSDALDRVPLPPRRLELLAKVLGGLLIVGNQLLDSLTHSIFDPRDLVPDLLDIGVVAPVALALAPQSRVLVAEVGDRTPHTAVQTQSITRLRTRDLLPAIAAEDEDAAHVFTSPLVGRSGWGVALPHLDPRDRPRSPGSARKGAEGRSRKPSRVDPPPPTPPSA